MKKSDLPEFQWTPACQEGFDQIKKVLMEAPVLAYPDYSKPFILETDASLKGLGAVLIIIIIIIIYLFSFDKVHVSCIDIYQQRLQCHSFCAKLTMLHYLFQYPVERGIPVRQYSLSTVVVGYPPITIVLIMTNQVF